MVRISDLLAYITYFIVTVVICAANLAATGRLVVRLGSRLLARYTRRMKMWNENAKLCAETAENDQARIVFKFDPDLSSVTISLNQHDSTLNVR